VKPADLRLNHPPAALLPVAVSMHRFASPERDRCRQGG
jgi:hypothetical protein